MCVVLLHCIYTVVLSNYEHYKPFIGSFWCNMWLVILIF